MSPIITRVSLPDRGKAINRQHPGRLRDDGLIDEVLDLYVALVGFVCNNANVVNTVQPLRRKVRCLNCDAASLAFSNDSIW